MEDRIIVIEDKVIEIEDLSRSYTIGDNTLYALQNVSLQVYKGDYIALMGPSGSGKSTFMNVIGCMDKPTAGSFKLKGKDVNTLTDAQLSEIRNTEIGFVFQTFNLLSQLDAVENVALPLVYANIPLKERRERAMEALKRVGLELRAKHKPNQLSGGQRQRVAIARALINKPTLLLADEPTGNLDTKTSYEIMDLFKELHEAGNTIILVTHEDDIAQYAQRIIRMKDGMIEHDA